MTTSPEPWCADTRPSGQTYIKDSNGQEIGMFLDARDADLVLDLFQQIKTVDELETQVDSLESEKGKLQKTIELLEDKIRKIENIVT